MEILLEEWEKVSWSLSCITTFTNLRGDDFVKWRWVVWVLLLIFLWVIITHFAEIEEMTDTFVQGQWDFLIIAGALQILYYLLYAALYQSAFDTVGIRSSLSELVPLTYASLFVNLAPTAGIGGAALFIYAFKKQEKSEARTTAGLILVQVVDNAESDGQDSRI
ncbi:MAG: hypothetical protein WBA22_11525 [Candidatus Methanofastidiosia archaeon]